MRLNRNFPKFDKNPKITVTSYKAQGTSLVVQWLRLHLPVQGVQVQSLVMELGSHLPHGQKTKT